MRRLPLPACLLAALLALVPGASATGAPAGRSNDPQPHRGGAAITTTVSATLFDCTAGFAVRRVEDGKRAMVTAGHCSDAQRGVPVVSGQTPYGSVARAFFDDGADTGLITATPAKPQVYAPTIWTDGGPAGEPVARRVLGKADAPVVGQKVCVSGQVTKLLCDVEVFSLSEGKECEDKPQPRRCTFGLAIAVKEHTQVSQAADSGAPVFVPVDQVVDGHPVHGAVIVGMLVAGGPRVQHGREDLFVFHTVKQIECALNVSVLTTADAESGDPTPPAPRDCRAPV
ncbi:hypothetical protein ACFYZ9_31110 [Streptomyces sp. NPDC001691]|uniref:hypothetical protein n=1 Tax=unclassified Streptomyces TaxID=2593676 RepID=UPI000DEAB35C|nr:hypothetical protein [Streptomyces sp. SDr-06]RCH64944.1 hypothetical protein DT019_30595 [Streptomyces sp. SDr-06]